MLERQVEVRMRPDEPATSSRGPWEKELEREDGHQRNDPSQLLTPLVANRNNLPFPVYWCLVANGPCLSNLPTSVPALQRLRFHSHLAQSPLCETPLKYSWLEYQPGNVDHFLPDPASASGKMSAPGQTQKLDAPVKNFTSSSVEHHITKNIAMARPPRVGNRHMEQDIASNTNQTSFTYQ